MKRLHICEIVTELDKKQLADLLVKSGQVTGIKIMSSWMEE